MSDIAVIWGSHRDDPVFHTHHSYWEWAVSSAGHKLTRYLWSEMGSLPSTHDLYLFVDFHPALYAIPKGYFKNAVLILFDSHHQNQAVVLQVCEQFDRCYFFEYTSATLARAYGLPVTWLPPAYCPEVFRPLGRQKVHDYAFIGQRDGWIRRNGDTKNTFLEKLGQASGIRGYMGQGIYSHEVNGIYNDAKVLFERTIFPSVGTRFFEIIGSGGFTLMNRLKPFSGIEMLAQDGIHYVSYDDTYVDFEKKLRYYLAHDEEREKIAKAGHAHFLENHTYTERLSRILADFNLAGER
jgi:glycosyltransferase involved in cell wall biosynthesis